MAHSIEEVTPNSEWDDAYFAFVEELLTKNNSRYESQTFELLKSRELSLKIENVVVRYRLDRVGCSFHVSVDSGVNFSAQSWTRLGWRKSQKRQGLPLFFAKTEADLLFKDDN